MIEQKEQFLQSAMEAIADLEGYVFHEMQLDELVPMLQSRANIYIIHHEMEPDELKENSYPAIDTLINLWHVVHVLGGELGSRFREYQDYLEKFK